MIKITWTKHAQIRQKEWEKKIDITKEEVEEILRNPGQVVPGDLNVQVAQAKIRNGLMRVLFSEESGDSKIITVYWTSKVEKILEGAKKMKIQYDSDADVLLLTLRDDPPVDAIEESGGVIVSYGEDKEPVSVEFLNASVRHLIRPGEMSVTLQAKTPTAL